MRRLRTRCCGRCRIEERDFGPVHAAVADTLNELGNVASLRNDYVGAQTRFQRVADIYRSIYGDHHYLVAIALSNVAYVKLATPGRSC
jgi:hypothetical protein